MILPTQRQQQARDRACHTFGYYMGLIMGHAGARVTLDNRAEWDGIIDDLIEACSPATEQLLPHKTPGSNENPRPTPERILERHARIEAIDERERQQAPNRKSLDADQVQDPRD